jgi:hypothetical protein
LGLDLSGSGQTQVVGFCGHDIELLDSLKSRKFLDWLSNYEQKFFGLAE